VKGSEWQQITATIIVGKSEAERIIRGFPTLNIGIITGTVPVILHFLSIFRSFFRNLSIETINTLIQNYIPDQVIMNLIIRQQNIPFVPYESGGIFTSLWRLFNRHEMNWRLGEWRHPNKSDYSFGLHLYDRSESFTESVLQSCKPFVQVSDIRFDNVHFD
jgi:hypothetical protein